MVLIPATQGYFIAAKQKAEFIGKWLEQMIDILTFPENVSKDIQGKKY
jgi:hypothetical protein